MHRAQGKNRENAVQGHDGQDQRTSAWHELFVSRRRQRIQRVQRLEQGSSDHNRVRGKKASFVRVIVLQLHDLSWIFQKESVHFKLFLNLNCLSFLNLHNSSNNLKTKLTIIDYHKQRNVSAQRTQSTVEP